MDVSDQPTKKGIMKALKEKRNNLDKLDFFKLASPTTIQIHEMLKWKKATHGTQIHRTFSFSWILMWSLTYIVCAVLKPDLADGALGRGMTPVNPIHLGFGSLLLLALVFNRKSLLLGCGIIEVFAGVASWVGFIRWNVSWAVGYDPLAQISMAFLDFVSAAFLLHYSFEWWGKHIPFQIEPVVS